MVNKQEIADSLQTSLGAMLDAIRYIRLSGTIDEAAIYSPLADGGDAARIIFVAPYACKVVSTIFRVEILETSNTTTELNLKKAASGTLLTNGTDVITPVNASGADTPPLTAHTNFSCVVVTAANANQMAAGDILFVVVGDVLEMSGLQYNVVIERLN